VKKAACFMSSKFQYGAFNGTPMEIGYYMRSQGMGWFDVKTYWELASSGWLASCDTTKMSVTVPTFSENFTGWAQATGWAIRTFGPHITYGWQENIWAPGSSWWIHQASSESRVEVLASQSVANFIKNLGIYQAPYQPDFLVFDRWERDDTIGIASGYYYNDRDWENFINFSAQVGKKLGNIPVMLWQIPGGHLQVTNDIDTRSGMSSSFTDYIFGDDKLGSNLANLRSDLVSLPLNSSIYNCGTACTSKAYLNASAYKWNQDNGKLKDLASKGIFAILWGGGSTTSVGTFPSDDGGWLAGKIRNYYLNPQPLSTIAPLPKPSASPSPKPTASPSPPPLPSSTPSVIPSPSPSPQAVPTPTPSSTPAPVNSCGGVANWNNTSVYTNGSLAAFNGVKYKANWWTQGSNPASNSGAYQVWSVVGSCSAVVTPTPSPTPAANGILCSSYSSWSDSGTYSAGNKVSYSGYVYTANWWTQGSNPANNNGVTGSGKPWTKGTTCQ
jgi:chitodextrinase